MPAHRTVELKSATDHEGVFIREHCKLPREQIDRCCLNYHVAMFRIVLQPEEQALLSAIRDGCCPASMVPGPVLLKLIALRMLACEAHGHPKLTALGEAALARMERNIH